MRICKVWALTRRQSHYGFFLLLFRECFRSFVRRREAINPPLSASRFSSLRMLLQVWRSSSQNLLTRPAVYVLLLLPNNPAGNNAPIKRGGRKVFLAWRRVLKGAHAGGCNGGEDLGMADRVRVNYSLSGLNLSDLMSHLFRMAHNEWLGMAHKLQY